MPADSAPDPDLPTNAHASQQPQHDYMEMHRKRHGERLDREERL